MAISGANEINTKISALIEAQFPDFIKSEGPLFVAFLEAYFEYLENYPVTGNPSGNAVSAVRKLKDNQDIDRTVDDFVEWFRRQFLIDIPQNVLADKKLLTKHIREFYRSRGSEKSFRFLFQILFNEPVIIEYPGDYILRASDGRWVRETIIRVTEPFTGSPYNFDGRVITGVSSNAKARVENVYAELIKGITYYVLTLQNVSGTFQDFEILSDGFGTTAKIASLQGSIQTFRITDGGAFNSTDDELTISGVTSGDGTASARVSKIRNTNDNDKITFKIVNPGSGYRPNSNTLVQIIGGNPISIAQFRVVSISNTQNISINTDIIDHVKNVVLNTSGVGSGTFSGLGQNTHSLSTTLAVANISTQLSTALKFENTTVGSINAISLISPGNGYKSPYSNLQIVVEDTGVRATSTPSTINPGKFKGADAVITANTAPGQIEEILLVSTGTSYLKDEKIILTNGSVGERTVSYPIAFGGSTAYTINTGYEANGVVEKISGITRLGGRYISSKGLLSSENKLQDNDYYQEFSYLIKSRKQLDTYSSYVKQLLHVAGTKMFGQIESVSHVDLPAAVITELSIFLSEIESITAADDVSATAVMGVINNESITTTDTVDGEVVKIVDIEESFTISDIVTAIADFVTAVSESVTSTETVNATTDFVGTVSESATSTETVNATSDFAGAVSESVTSTETPDATADFAGTVSESVTSTETIVGDKITSDSVSESVTSTETPDATADFAGAVSESVTSTETPNATADFAGAVSESVTSTDVTNSQLFIAWPSTFIRVYMANSQVAAWSSDKINTYDELPIATFDNTVRLIRGTVGNLTFANGTLKAATGSISNDGVGSSLIIVNVGDTWDFSTLYTTNTIYSNSVFTIKTAYPAPAANATFSYAT